MSLCTLSFPLDPGAAFLLRLVILTVVIDNRNLALEEKAANMVATSIPRSKA